MHRSQWRAVPQQLEGIRSAAPRAGRQPEARGYYLYAEWCFKPYSGVSTAVLVFTKTDAGGTDNVWMYNMEGDGFTLDDKRDADEKHNDIPDILNRWANLADEAKRERTDKSFLVPKQEIIDNDYDFSFNKYTKTEYEHIEYPPTEEILADLADLNRQMAESLAELNRMLGGDCNE